MRWRPPWRSGSTRRYGHGADHGPAEGGRCLAGVPLSRRGSGHPADRPPRGRQRHAGHQLHPQPGHPERSAATISSSAAVRRSTATRPRSDRSAPKSSDLTQITYLKELVGVGRRYRPHSAEHRQRLGDRRGRAAGAGHGVGSGQHGRVLRRLNGSCSSSGPAASSRVGQRGEARVRRTLGRSAAGRSRPSRRRRSQTGAADRAVGSGRRSKPIWIGAAWPARRPRSSASNRSC